MNAFPKNFKVCARNSQANDIPSSSSSMANLFKGNIVVVSLIKSPYFVLGILGKC